MYTSTNATREQGLKAAAAASRAMQRHMCCKSQYKFKCFSCGKMVNRGDKITRCNRAPTGMTLRYRGADSINGLTMAETSFYQGASGKNMWVHAGCNPCYWDEGLDYEGNKLTYKSLRPISTEWYWKVQREWEEWVGDDENWELMGVPYFCMVKGYPKEKFMKDRIINAVTRFQAIWRGYLYKKAYPEALCQKKENEAINIRIQELVTSKEMTRETIGWSWCLVGEHCEILFDYNRKNEAIYSGEIIKTQGQGGDEVYIWVRYHDDDEMKRYHWRKFKSLKDEAENFKKKMGWKAKIIGKISSRRCRVYSKN